MIDPELARKVPLGVALVRDFPWIMLKIIHMSQDYSEMDTNGEILRKSVRYQGSQGKHPPTPRPLAPADAS